MKELERQHAHSSRLESIGQLAAGIAHEINTPMQCVANEVEFLEEQFVYLVDVVNQCQQIIEEDKSLSEADHL
ncbi:sensory histidine kinase AtoS [Aeoliella mucimassa]|uniref:histidine kinase n=2 Tax=Aeoliella mucimassa TaxID=2527972 RepID=A0A518APB6_9BACT|nr:sensory histidine kinase AtoS [Aeoliella mucimassa]